MSLSLSRNTRQPLLAAAVSVAVWSLFGSGCSSEKEPISAASSKYQVAGDEDSSETDSQAGTPSEAESHTARVTDQPDQSPYAASGRGDAGNVSDGLPLDKPPAVSREELESYEVPDGSVEELLAFMEQIDSKMEQQDAQWTLADVRGMLQAKVEAADKILAADGLEQNERASAILNKLHSLSGLVSLGDQAAGEALRQQAHAAAGDEDAEVAAQGKMILFMFTVQQTIDDEQKNPAAVIDEFRKFLAGGAAGQAEFMAVREAASQMANAGYVDQAVAAFQLIGDTFKAHEDEQLAAEAGELLRQVRFLEFEQHLQKVLVDEAPADRLLEAARAILDAQPAGNVLALLAEGAINLEYSGNVEAARPMYGLIREKFASHGTEQLAQQANATLEKAEKRLALLGGPLQITGVHTNGSPLDWSRFEGKVVLVDFWATWCGPCLAEIPNLEKNYIRFRDQGFEIVGVNLDEDPQALAGFLKQKPLPWTTVVSGDPEKQGFKNDNAVKCGVEAIPFLVLIDREGNVAGLHMRGEKLTNKLEAIFSGAGEPPEETSSVRPPAGNRAFVGAGPVANVVGVQLAAVSQRSEPAAGEDTADESDAETAVNPYLPSSGLSPNELVVFILEMRDRPKSIQGRPGFAEAVALAADQLLAADTTDKNHIIAAEAKFDFLHAQAMLGDQNADRHLAEFAEQMGNDKRERIAEIVGFLKLERRALDSEKLSLEQVPALLSDLQEYFSKEKLSQQHLRIASATVRTINLLEDGDQREQHFSKFGKLFAKSDHPRLARYGRNLAEANKDDRATP